MRLTEPPVDHVSPPRPGRHSLLAQDAVWTEFLGLSAIVVDSLEKGVAAVCEGRFDLIPEVEDEEADSDRREVQIEREVVRILALFEPVACDLRRMATVLKVTRDWERIADLAVRIARRARKLARDPSDVDMPEALKSLARRVLGHVRGCHQALAAGDTTLARSMISADQEIDDEYRNVRKSIKACLTLHADQIDAWLLLLNTARNLERIADHATVIAQTVIYLREGIIVRHEASKRGESH